MGFIYTHVTWRTREISLVLARVTVPPLKLDFLIKLHFRVPTVLCDRTHLQEHSFDLCSKVLLSGKWIALLFLYPGQKAVTERLLSLTYNKQGVRFGVVYSLSVD